MSIINNKTGWFFLLLIMLVLVGCATQQPDWQPPDVVAAANKYRVSAENSLLPAFELAGVPYPPEKIALLAFKQEKKLELWAYYHQRWYFIKSYYIFAISGHAGPEKLHQGDDQVPEGIYRITSFNPESRFHLSLHLNYPNHFDRMEARHDGRYDLGGDIFIHGRNHSIGCLPVGQAIEELFVLVYQVGLDNTEVVIAPNDLRYAPPVTQYRREPYWVVYLYKNIYHALQPFKT